MGDFVGDHIDPLASNPRPPRAVFAILIGSLLAITALVRVLLLNDRPVILIVLALLALAPALLGFGFIGMGWSSDARHIAVVGSNSRTPAWLRGIGAFMSAAAVGALGGASFGIPGAIVGALGGGGGVFFGTGESMPMCQQCSRRHRDYWDNPYCGDGFRWTQQDLNRDDNLWITREHAAVIVGVSHNGRLDEAHRIAEILFHLARAKGVVSAMGDGERIQQRELHLLLPEATGRLLPAASPSSPDA